MKMECEQCGKSRITREMIGVKTDIVRYFCDWECLNLYCHEMLNILEEGDDGL